MLVNLIDDSDSTYCSFLNDGVLRRTKRTPMSAKRVITAAATVQGVRYKDEVT
jgi:hypothetical protein